MFTKAKLALVISTSVLALVGCNKSSSVTPSIPEVTPEIVYGHAMCEPVVSVSVPGYDQKMKDLLAQENPLSKFVNKMCYTYSPYFSSMNTESINRTDYEIDGQITDVLRYDLDGVFRIPSTTNEYFTNASWIISKWNKEGIVTESKMVGEIIILNSEDQIVTNTEKTVDIKFNNIEGWKNANFLQVKEKIFDISDANFANSVDMYPAFIQDFLIPNKMTDLHKVVYSYCSLDTTKDEVAPFIHNSPQDENNNANNGEVKGLLVSRPKNMFYAMDNGEGVYINNIMLGTANTPETGFITEVGFNVVQGDGTIFEKTFQCNVRNDKLELNNSVQSN